MRNIFIFGLLLIQTTFYSQNCNCDSLFVQTQKIVEDNYAGWFDKVTSYNRTTYNQWTEKHYLLSKNKTTDSDCSKQLQEWISFFKDKHLRIKFKAPKVISNDKKESKEIKIIRTDLSELQVNQYVSKAKKLDPIEGIYESPSYRLGITQVQPNLFYATVITTQNENWKAGEVKLVITKSDGAYEGTFYEGDKSDVSTHKVQLVDNILDFEILFFEKISPNVTEKRDLTEYEMSKDSYAPSLTFKNDVAIWKFPSFQNNAYEQTTYLLNKYKDKLETTPYWIIDLSNNSGGDYSIGLQLIDYIYSKPIEMYNTEMRLTKSNYDIWYKSYISNYYESLDSINKSKLDVRLNKMKANFNTLFNDDGKKTENLTLEKTKTFPSKIALLMNENTVSSGELFTMIARQSSKVTVFGTNSGGMIDYGNVVQYKTICPTVTIQLPTNRYLWLNEGYSVDKEGLKPDVYLKDGNWTEEAVKVLKK